MRLRVIYTDKHFDISDNTRNKLFQMGIEISHIPRSETCLQSIREQTCHLLISTVKTSDTDGIELLIKAKKVNPLLPVVFVVDSGDIKTAVRAMKAGAADCLERPIKAERLLSVIESAISQTAQKTQPINAELSKIEEKVLKLILDGKTNVEIAELLQRSRRTIEVHRSHIMQKLKTPNLAELIKKSVLTGWLKL